VSERAKSLVAPLTIGRSPVAAVAGESEVPMIQTVRPERCRIDEIL
jgi:hypothetical protein